MKKLAKVLKSQYSGITPISLTTQEKSITSYTCTCGCVCTNSDVTAMVSNAVGIATSAQTDNSQEWIMKTLSKALKSRYGELSPAPIPTNADTIKSYSYSCTCICQIGDNAGVVSNYVANEISNVQDSQIGKDPFQLGYNNFITGFIYSFCGKEVKK